MSEPSKPECMLCSEPLEAAIRAASGCPDSEDIIAWVRDLRRLAVELIRERDEARDVAIAVTLAGMLDRCGRPHQPAASDAACPPGCDDAIEDACPVHSPAAYAALVRH